MNQSLYSPRNRVESGSTLISTLTPPREECSCTATISAMLSNTGRENLFPKLISLNSPHLDFEHYVFSEKNMNTTNVISNIKF